MSSMGTFFTFSVLSDINGCVDLLKSARSAVSALYSRWTGAEQQRLRAEALQLECDKQQRLRAEASQLECDKQKLEQLLEDTLHSMHKFINNAEWRIHESDVAGLLAKLKDAVYEAEDLLDELRWHAQKVKLDGDASQPSLREFVDTVNQCDLDELKKIHERLHNLSGQSMSMGLHEAPRRFDKSIRPETTSYLSETRIFGRQNELEKVLEFLGVPTTSKRKRAKASRVPKVPVLPIVGLGGVGKTTLAQLISQDDRVKSHFTKICWICVSDDFDVKRLTLEALQHFPSSSGTNLNALQAILADKLKNEKILLVLDDMWDDALNEWHKFYAPFKNVVEGSMILVTTRTLNVANRVGTMEPFPLETLEADYFWNFFKLCSFGSETYSNYPELESIGRSIVPKLKGNPLAAKTLGRLLRTDLNTTHWNNILNSELWQIPQDKTDILPALRLSYTYLPNPLRRCFSFCAVYPQDHYFEINSLVDIWVAEGFVESQKGSIPTQDVGRRYFDELLNRSFFQAAPNLQGAYVIHNLMHEMAQKVSEDECFIIKNVSDIEKVPPNVRHLSIYTTASISYSKLSSLCKCKKVRTLLCNNAGRKDGPSASQIGDLFCEFPRIRVFRCAFIEKFAESISRLKHLRYLEIYEDCFLKTLSPSICCFYNLQFLYAKKCEFESLPSDFSKLVNLQKVDSKGLQYESGHLWCDLGEGQGIRVLKNINQFSGSLLITSLDRIKSKGDAAEAELNRKKSINSLMLFWWGYGDPNTMLEVLEALDPPKDLKSLRLVGYKGEFLPSWFQRDNLENLISVEIVWCNGFVRIPCYKILHGHAINRNEIPTTEVLVEGSDNNINSKGVGGLSFLTIQFCENLSSVEELLSPAYQPDMKKIVIAGCPKISSMPVLGDFYSLEELEVSWCPQISSMLALPSSLRKLKLVNCGKLTQNIDHALSGCRSITHLDLGYLSVTAIPLQEWCNNLPALKELTITYCGSLTLIGLQEESSSSSIAIAFSSLTHLTIQYCYKLSSLDDLLNPNCIPNIERICVQYCNEVHLPGERFGGFDCLKDLRLSRINWRSRLVLPSSLQNLCLEDLGNADIRGCLERGNLTSLISMTLRNCQNLRSIPGHLWNSNLAALQRLTITDCPNLESIGGPEAIAKIKNVDITDCPKLIEMKRTFRRGSNIR